MAFFPRSSEEMAESIDSDSDLKISSELLRCNICYDKFKQPRTLPCLHSFCETCLQQHVESSMSSRHNVYFLGNFHTSSGFACPTCREEIPLPAHGVLGFRHDFRIEQMQDFVQTTMMKKSQKEATAKTSKGRTCQFCDKSSSPGLFCRDCLKEICQDCAVKHKTISIFADHRISKPTDSKSTKSCCSQHRAEVIGYLCLTCDQAVCAICVMSDGHEGHQVTALQAGLRKYKDHLSSQLKALQAKVIHITEVQNDLAANEEEVNNLRTKTATDIKQRVDSLVDAIRKEEKKLLEELDHQCDAELSQVRTIKAKVTKTLEGMTTIQDLVQSLLYQEMTADMVPVYKDVINKIDSGFEDSLLLKYDSNFAVEFAASSRKVKLGRLYRPSEIKPGVGLVIKKVHSDVELHQIDNNLITDISPRSRRRTKMAASLPHVPHLPAINKTSGSILPCGQNGRPSPPQPLPRRTHLVAKFGRFGSNGGEFSAPRDLCFLEEGKLMVVADTNNDRIQVFNSDGLLIRVIGQGRLKPWGVTATPAGNIAVTDNLEKCIKIYDKLGNLVHKFGKFLCPCGIAINGIGEFIVTDFFSTFACIFSRQGRPIRQFEFRGKNDQHMCGASRIATTGDKIIISDVSNSCVKFFDREGQLLRTVSNSAYLISPQGVAVSQQGHVLVADAMKQHVLVMDSEGRHLGVILQGKDHDIKDPTGLALYGKRLGITQMKLNQIKVYTFDK